MFVSTTRTTTSSLPIPIIQNKTRNGRGQIHNRGFSSSPSVRSYELVKMHSSSPLNSFDTSSHISHVSSFNHIYDMDDDYCVISCNDISAYTSSCRVHLVDGLNVDKKIKDCDKYYVLCDCPKIKTPFNHLSYSLLETKKGILAFTNKSHAMVLKEHLQLDYHVVEMTKDDFTAYNVAMKTNAIVLYNSYTDVEIKASYFLYYTLERSH